MHKSNGNARGSNARGSNARGSNARGSNARGSNARDNYRGKSHDNYRGNVSATSFNKLTSPKCISLLVPPLRVPESDLMPPPLALMTDEPDVGDPFEEIKRTLNATKDKLETIPSDKFSKFMNNLDMYFGLKKRVISEFGMIISTNASLKMYELIIQMKLLVCQSGALPKVRAFCNAELPGAFIVSINHYLKTYCPETNFDWVASSYLPTDKSINTTLDDAYGIYNGNRDHWIMGPPPNALIDHELKHISGDLTDANNVITIANTVHRRYNGLPTGADIYTSDGGFDVSSDYSTQEEQTSMLNFGQVLCGILSLAIGGSLVTKQFTFYNVFSRSLIILVSALFEETYIVKPQTSRPTNSEIYIVAKGFRGIGKPLAVAVLTRMGEYKTLGINLPTQGTPIIDMGIASVADSALLRIATQIHRNQNVAFIEEAVAIYNEWKNNIQQLSLLLFPITKSIQNAWFDKNQMIRIRAEFQLNRETLGKSTPHMKIARDKFQQGKTLMGANTNATPILASRMVNKQSESKSRDIIPGSGDELCIIVKELISGQIGDVKIIQQLFPQVAIVISTDKYPTKRRIHIHNEHYFEKIRGDVNYIYINHEYVLDWDLKAIKDGDVIPLCKTNYAREVLASMGVDCKVIGSNSPDCRDLTVAKDPRLIVHLAGKSHMKGTYELLQSWFKYGGTSLDVDLIITRPNNSPRHLDIIYWESLGAEKNVEHRGIPNLEKKGNVYLAKYMLPEDTIMKLMNAARLHICPSIMEGWGHIINTARSVNGIVITTDAKPMNELIDESCGFLVPVAEEFKTTLGKVNAGIAKWYPPIISNLPIGPVDQKALMEAIHAGIHLSSDDSITFGKESRRRYEASALKFTTNIRTIITGTSA